MSFNPENPLEHSLVRAIGDPAWRPQFYRDLVASDVFALLGGQPSTAGTTGPEPDQDLVLTVLTSGEKRFVPIFSSLSRTQGIAREGDRFVSVNARTLFQMVGRHDVFLNPGSACNKEFTVTEVTAIADGSFWESHERTLDRPTRCQIGVPADYPHEFAESLKRLFAQKKEITRAWLALVLFPDTGGRETMIGIEATHQIPGIATEVEVVAYASPVPDEPVTVMTIGPNAGPSSMFSHIAPFYERN